MTLTLELDPIVESGLLAQARSRGLSLQAYAQQLLEEHGAAASAEVPADERIRAFNEFVEGMESHALVSESAFHRPDWYPDRG